MSVGVVADANGDIPVAPGITENEHGVDNIAIAIGRDHFFEFISVSRNFDAEFLTLSYLGRLLSNPCIRGVANRRIE
jgi:hypothetical protein